MITVKDRAVFDNFQLLKCVFKLWYFVQSIGIELVIHCTFGDLVFPNCYLLAFLCKIPFSLIYLGVNLVPDKLVKIPVNDYWKNETVYQDIVILSK